MLKWRWLNQALKLINYRARSMYNASQKHESTLLRTERSCSTKYFWKKSFRFVSSHLHASFGTFCVQIDKFFFEKSLIEVGISNFYASFGTFCVQIGQLFKAQWVFEKCLNMQKSLFLNENDVDFDFFWKFKISLCPEYLTNLSTKAQFFFQIFCCTWTFDCQNFVQYIHLE